MKYFVDFPIKSSPIPLDSKLLIERSGEFKTLNLTSLSGALVDHRHDSIDIAEFSGYSSYPDTYYRGDNVWVDIDGLLPKDNGLLFVQATFPDWTSSLQPPFSITAYLQSVVSCNDHPFVFESCTINEACDGYACAVLLPSGQVFAIPNNTGTVAIFNPTTRTKKIVGSIYNASYYGVLLKDGDVFCVPKTAPNAISYNVGSNKVTNHQKSFIGSNLFSGAVIVKDSILCSPYNATGFGIFDLSSNPYTYRTIGTNSTSGGFFGCVLCSESKVILVPHNSTKIALYNQTTDSISYSSNSIFNLASHRGGVLLPDGKVFCVPYNSYPVIVDTASLSFSTISDSFFVGTNMYSSGVLLPNGKVLCGPYTRPHPIIVDPATGQVQELDTNPALTLPIAATLTVSENTVMFVPENPCLEISLVSINTSEVSFSKRYLTSPYANVF